MAASRVVRGVWFNGLEGPDTSEAVFEDEDVKGKAGGRSGLTSFLTGVEGFGCLGRPKRCCSDERAAPPLGVLAPLGPALELLTAGALKAENRGPPTIGEGLATFTGLGVVGAMSFILNEGAAVADILIMGLGFFFSGDVPSKDGVIQLF